MPDWPHAPIHRLDEEGTYFVTAGTYLKRPLFDCPERLTLVHDSLLELASDYGWRMQAWAVLINHYHFVAISPTDPSSLRRMLTELHKRTGLQLNALDRAKSRRVWYQFWDTQLTYQRSYLARLRYVHENPVRHGVVKDALRYRWCSAAWFERTADPAFRKVVKNFQIDRLKVHDDF